ncbi:MAG: hypothetical protein Q9167_003638 [Letrouitia subvulpina]
MIVLASPVNSPRSLQTAVVNFRGLRQGTTGAGAPKCLGVVWMGQGVLTGCSLISWPNALEKLKVEGSDDTLKVWSKKLRSGRFTAPEQAFLNRYIDRIVGEYTALEPQLGKDDALRLLRNVKSSPDEPRAAELSGFKSQPSVCFSGSDYSILPACFMCRIAYPLGYTAEALGGEDKSLNPNELRNRESRGQCAEALLLMQHLRVVGMGIGNV